MAFVDAAEEVRVGAFLRTLILCELTPAVRQQAVRRRTERLKLPDAIICATALEQQVDLWTNDQRLWSVPGVQCRQVALQAATSP